MAHNPHDMTPRWLAPLTSEVVVTVPRDGRPRITEISPRVAAWTGSSVDRLIGRPVAEAFEDIIPGLDIVAEEVRASKRPVRDYRISFEDYAGVRRTVCMQASLRPEKSESGDPCVIMRLEEVPVPREGAQAEPEADAWHGMIGRSSVLLNVIRKIEIYGPTEAPVLITGETGTGKELAAKAIHARSRRRRNPILAVNCSTLSGDLLESELFGHEKGAFTGAHRLHRGRFERAHGGTLFLDEIGEMPLSAQAKLLRVLEEGMIERIGGERMIDVDVRLVTATNVPLEWAVQNKTFRLDLYHRLEVLRLHMPPLRERLDDIPLLVAYFLRQFDQQYQRHVRRLTPDAIALLRTYSWPGNIRELRNVLERVYVESTTEAIGRKAFEEWQRERSQFFPGAWDLQARQDALAARPVLVTPYRGASPIRRPLLPESHDTQAPIDLAPAPTTGRGPQEWVYVEATDGTLPRGPRKLTRERIEEAYRRTAGNLTHAAKYLGVHKATLYRRLKTLGLTREDLEASVSSLGADTDDA